MLILMKIRHKKVKKWCGAFHGVLSPYNMIIWTRKTKIDTTSEEINSTHCCYHIRRYNTYRWMNDDVDILQEIQTVLKSLYVHDIRNTLSRMTTFPTILFAWYGRLFLHYLDILNLRTFWNIKQHWLKTFQICCHDVYFLICSAAPTCHLTCRWMPVALRQSHQNLSDGAHVSMSRRQLCAEPEVYPTVHVAAIADRWDRNITEPDRAGIASPSALPVKWPLFIVAELARLADLCWCPFSDFMITPHASVSSKRDVGSYILQKETICTERKEVPRWCHRAQIIVFHGIAPLPIALFSFATRHICDAPAIPGFSAGWEIINKSARSITSRPLSLAPAGKHSVKLCLSEPNTARYNQDRYNGLSYFIFGILLLMVEERLRKTT